MVLTQLRRLSLVLLALLLAALFTTGMASAQSGSTTNVTITETEFKLDPAQVTVPLNTPVQFTVKNAGTVEHNLKVELPSANIEHDLFAQNLKPGETQTASFTFTQAGSWEIYCPVDGHEGAGMKGTLTVVSAQNAAQGAAGSGGQNTNQGQAPSRLPTTGAANDLTHLALVGLLIAALGVGLSFAKRPARS